MSSKPEKFFPLLEKILQRNQLNESTLPIEKEQWMNFLTRISNCFYDFEQEHYLLERSMIISSKEMVELNERLELAQHIAHIGYWYYNPFTEKNLWSKETYRLFELDPAFPPPSYEECMKLIFEEDREKLNALINNALQKGEPYSLEFRIHTDKEKKLRWVYVKATPQRIIHENNIAYTLSGIIMDITERKEAEEQFVELNKKLISISRQAGMSEVATSILHNIGNILNSVNISIAMIKEIIDASELKNLKKVTDLINANFKNPTYLIEDPKGKLIPEYMTELSKQFSTEHEKISIEITNLIKHLDYMKNVVSMQKNISGIMGIKEKIEVNDLCNLALEMDLASLKKNNIEIKKDYQFNDFIFSDKSKLIQILVNLISNAKDALKQISPELKRVLTISTLNENNNTLKIIVQDNGIGIPKENLIKIFSMGFTTKETGHGYGLHTSSIAAKELGGALEANSSGVQSGAKFILSLPLSAEKSVAKESQNGVENEQSK